MAPRSRASQGGNSPSATLNIDDLPEAVLVRCLGFLEMVERQRAALACRRFAAAARAPQLLREVNVHIGSDLPKLHSLTAWLTRHGSHVRRLTGYVASDDDPDWNAAAASCLAAVGTAGQLDELNLEGILDSTEWLAAMRSLQRCRLVNDENGELRVSAALGGLTALESLDLQGEPIKLLPARLPASITYLHLCDSSDNMPQQVAQLPRLARLKLRLCSYSADSLDQLSRLSSSLTRLEIDWSNLPPNLQAFSRLEHLELQRLNAGDVESFNGALPHLTQLTCLVVAQELVAAPALSGLTRLQRCSLQHLGSAAADNGALPDQPLALPDSPWLRGLRWLGADLDIFVASTTVLRQAAALEFVCIKGSHKFRRNSWRRPAVAALFDWMARHPPLQIASFESFGNGLASAYDSRDFARLLLQLSLQRPSLQLHCLTVNANVSTSMWDLLDSDQ